MEKKKLTKGNILHQLAEFGFFSDQIPECFCSSDYAKSIEQLINHTGKTNVTSPTVISIFKNEKSRRLISIPNPKEYARLISLYYLNWNEFRKKAKSINSLSNISNFDINYDEFIDNENLKDRFNIKSNYINSIMESIKASLGYKYCLSLDISNFYNSVYTHSITWECVAKKMQRKCIQKP